MVAACQFGQFRWRQRQHTRARMPFEGFVVRQSAEGASQCRGRIDRFAGTHIIGTPEFGHFPIHMAHQLLDEVHLLFVRVFNSVPFHHGEFGVVVASHLITPEGTCDLINGSRTGRQQSFHPEFRGCLQIQLFARRHSRFLLSDVGCRLTLDDEGLQVKINGRVVGQDGRLDFPIAVCVEKGPYGSQCLGS